MTSKTQIQYVQQHSIVRLADGRLGVAPNRGDRGRWCVQVGGDVGVILKGSDEVEVVELAIVTAHKRLAELQAAEQLSETITA